MIPKYQRIADRLREQLTDDTRRLTRLPTEKELCARYQVSRQTIRQALAQLESDGLIRRRQGSGAYATGLHPDAAHNRIAILLPTDSDYTYARLRNDLQQPLQRQGFSVSFHLTHHSISAERAILEELLDAPLRGLIAEPVKSALPNPNLDLYEHLWAKQLPTVFLRGSYVNFPPHEAVTEDDYGGACRLTQYLIDRRHTMIAGIFRSDTQSGILRYSGYADTCCSDGLPWDDAHVLWYDTAALVALQKKQACGFLTDFIRQKLTACSAVVCQDDEIAYWLTREIHRAGLSVPDDIAVAGFDNSFLCEFSVPTLTSLAPVATTPAAAAADLLLDRLRGQSVSSVHLHYELIERASTLRV